MSSSKGAIPFLFLLQLKRPIFILGSCFFDTLQGEVKGHSKSVPLRNSSMEAELGVS